MKRYSLFSALIALSSISSTMVGMQSLHPIKSNITVQSVIDASPWAKVIVLTPEQTERILAPKIARQTLFLAIMNNQTHEALRLIDLNVDLINVQDHAGDTPLHHAVHKKNLALVQALINQPNMNQRLANNKGQTAYDKAMSMLSEDPTSNDLMEIEVLLRPNE